MNLTKVHCISILHILLLGAMADSSGLVEPAGSPASTEVSEERRPIDDTDFNPDQGEDSSTNQEMPEEPKDEELRDKAEEEFMDVLGNGKLRKKVGKTYSL